MSYLQVAIDHNGDRRLDQEVLTFQPGGGVVNLMVYYAASDALHITYDSGNPESMWEGLVWYGNRSQVYSH